MKGFEMFQLPETSFSVMILISFPLIRKPINKYYLQNVLSQQNLEYVCSFIIQYIKIKLNILN